MAPVELICKPRLSSGHDDSTTTTVAAKTITILTTTTTNAPANRVARELVMTTWLPPLLWQHGQTIIIIHVDHH